MLASEDQEPEARLCNAGWKIRRLDADATLHDSHITSLRQWWRRCVRRGVGYAQMWSRHRHRHEAVAIARIMLWMVIVPIVVIAISLYVGPLALLLLLLYPLRVLRLAIQQNHKGANLADATAWAVHCIAAAFPYLCGMLW